MASFNAVNYALRPNKNVERKLMVEILRSLDKHFQFQNYRYIGLGSLWFSDFRLMHREFAMNDMISIEKRGAGRAMFNRPFACVEVKEGDSRQVLPTLNLREKKSIVWLDHDSDLQGPALEDLRTVVEKLPSGSVVVVTVNAHSGQLKKRKDYHGEELDQTEALRQDVGDLIPNPLAQKDLSQRNFPKTVSKILQTAFQSALVKAGRTEEFQMLFNFSYRDNAPMVTVGGLILSVDDQREWDTDARSEFRDLADETPFQIDVPHLTSKEKNALDRCLPTDDPGKVGESSEFPLPRRELESYVRFYRHYPLFGEYQL